MDFKMLLEKIIELFVALVPAITFMIASFNRKQKQINSTLVSMDESNSSRSKKLEKDIVTKFDKITNDNANFVDKTIVKVDNFLEEANDTLNVYYEKIDNLSGQVAMSININKTFMDMMVEVLKQDPKMIEKGIYSNINKKVNMTKEELESYPNLLESDLELLKDTLIKTRSNIGEENFSKLLKEIDYEEKERKKL